VIDGHRRCLGLLEKGRTQVKAVIRSDLTEEQAYVLAYMENTIRKTYKTTDRANALWHAIMVRKRPEEEVLRDFGVKKRQAYYYLELLELDPRIRKRVDAGGITLAHALAVKHLSPEEALSILSGVVRTGISARSLRRKLRSSTRKGANPPRVIEDDNGGFRLSSLRYTPDWTQGDKRRLINQLERALEILRETV
jgi:ParB family chromosome partitioning protein